MPCRCGTYDGNPSPDPTLNHSPPDPTLAPSRPPALALAPTPSPTPIVPTLTHAGVGRLYRIAYSPDPHPVLTQVWDAYGNLSEPPLSAFDVKLCCNSSPIVVKPVAKALLTSYFLLPTSHFLLPTSYLLQVKPVAKALGKGRFSFSYHAELAGTYSAHVRVATRLRHDKSSSANKRYNKPPEADASNAPLELVDIDGSPFSVCVEPAAMHPPACGVRWVSARNATVGEPVELCVQSRDRYFNERSEGGDVMTIMLRSFAAAPGVVPTEAGLKMGLPAAPLVVTGRVRDGRDGTYTAQVTAEVSGDYALFIANGAVGSGSISSGRGGGGSARPTPLVAAEAAAAEAAVAAEEEEADIDERAVQSRSSLDGRQSAAEEAEAAAAVLRSAMDGPTAGRQAAATARLERLGSKRGEAEQGGGFTRGPG